MGAPLINPIIAHQKKVSGIAWMEGAQERVMNIYSG
jgi:hypothetical protein